MVQTRFGPVVANSRGQVLYDYADDTPTTSACQAQWCLVDWPPLQAQGTPTAVAAITASITVIDGAGGVPQVTLGGHPLYTFAGDLHPGDTTGPGDRIGLVPGRPRRTDGDGQWVSLTA